MDDRVGDSLERVAVQNANLRLRGEKLRRSSVTWGTERSCLEIFVENLNGLTTAHYRALPRRQAFQQAQEVFHARDALQHLLQAREGGRDVGQEVGAFLHEAEEAVGAKRLHEPLHGAEVEDGGEVLRQRDARARMAFPVIEQETFPLPVA